MKILEVTTSFPRYQGDSAGIFIYKKAQVINLHGHQNDVLVPHGKNTMKHEMLNNVRVFRFNYFIHKKLHKLTYGHGVPENFKRSFLAKIQLPFLIVSIFFNCIRLGRDYDIIHTNWSIAGLGAVFAAKLLKKKFVLTMHGAEVFKLKRNLIISFLIANTNNLITNSNFTLKEIQKYYSLRNKNLSILPFGVDKVDKPEKYQDINFWQNKFDIPFNKKVIFALGRLVERKGFEYLLRAFKQLEDKYDTFYLILCGRGPEKNKLESIILHNNIKNVKIIDYIKEEEIPYFYKNAFCFVLPSIVDSEGDTEGLGVVNIEALNYGTPVISTNVGGINDVIKNKKTGLLVKEKNEQAIIHAVEELLKNKNLYKNLQINGRKYVNSHFVWDSIAKKYVNYYENL